MPPGRVRSPPGPIVQEESIEPRPDDIWCVLVDRLEIARCDSRAAASWIMSSLKWRDLRIRQLAQGMATTVGSLRDNWRQVVRVNELDESDQNELWQMLLKVISEQEAPGAN